MSHFLLTSDVFEQVLDIAFGRLRLVIKL